MTRLQEMMAAMQYAGQGLQDRKADYADVPAEVLFARDFVQEQQILQRPIMCRHGYCEPDVMPGQDYAVGAAFDLLYGYFQRASQQLKLPEPPWSPDSEDSGETSGE